MQNGSESRISRWMAIFVDREVEFAYRMAQLAGRRRQALWVIVATTGYYVLSLIAHLASPDGDVITDAVLGRAVAILAAAAAIAATLRARRPTTLDAVVVAMGALLVTVNLTAIPLRSHYQIGSAISILGAVVVIYAFLPTGILGRLGLALYTSVAGLALWSFFQTPPPLPSDAARLALWVAALNLLGLYAANRMGRSQRRQFALLREQAGALARLEAEVAERRRIEAELREATRRAEDGARAKAEFLAMMSHEIRTPMNGVVGTARLLLERPLGAEERDLVETIDYSGEALLTILDDILDFSKLEAGRLEIETATFDLPRLVHSVGALMGSRARAKGLLIEIMPAPDLPRWVRSDPTRLRQILFNLISNAVKFTERGAVRVAVTAAPAASGIALRFAVADTGIGIPEAARDGLFTEFSQADSSISRRFGGTGLGLAICKRLTGLLGGQIGFDTEEGRGSTFWFVLPVGLGREPAPRPAKAAAATPPLRVLLAEDHAINQKVAAGLLRARGHEVVIVADGAAAVRAVAAGAFEVVLMDLQMPGMDGFEATDRIRALPGEKAKIPIIAMTANALRGDADRCRAAGMDGHIAKPIDPAALDAALARRSSGDDAAGAPSPIADGEVDHGRLRQIREFLGEGVARDLARDFFATAPETAERIERLAAGGAAEARALAHDLKSLARTFGAVGVGALAEAIESASREGRPDEARRLAQALPERIRQAMEALSLELAD